MEAMLWITRTGCPWRDLPSEFPNWRSVYTRWRRWVQRRVWAQVLAWLAEDHDREAYAVDATYVRVHAHGTRARGGYAAQAVGRSRGGLTSKVHLLTDALGYPVRFVVTGGERNDVTQAPALLPPGQGAQVLCDRGYDADWWRDRLRAAGHQPVVPGRQACEAAHCEGIRASCPSSCRGLVPSGHPVTPAAMIVGWSAIPRGAGSTSELGFLSISS